MVREDKKMKCYYCEECEMAYTDRKKVCECEEWCKKHRSCNLEIIKHSLKVEGRLK